MASHRNVRVLAAVGGLLALMLSTGAAFAEGLKDTYRDAGPPGRVDRGVWISGFDHQEDSYYVFSGITVALNGNIDRDGFALRVMGLYEDFDLDPGSGRTWQGDVMLGYLFNRRGYYGGVFAGLDVQDVRLRPDDPSADVRGTETGFKVAGYVVSDRSLPHYFNLYGHYSTAFESYYLRTRVGLSRHRVAFGPEYILAGDEDDRTQRFGGFLTFDLKLDRPVEVTLNAGYQWADDSGTGTSFGRGGGDGAYGGIMVIVPF
jgi:hypothetical protein